MMTRLFAFLLCLALLPSGAAHAQQYTQPSWPSMLRTMIRFNAMDIGQQDLVDEYAIVTECKIYQTFYHDDFKWNEVRNAVRDDVKNNVATYPMNYYYDVRLQLDHYDFDSKVFRFTAKSALQNVNTFVLYAVSGTSCGTADVHYVPRIYRAVLQTPVYLDGIPLAEGDAKALLAQMNQDGNADHLINARFNLRVVYIEPLHKLTTKHEAKVITSYTQMEKGTEKGSVRFDVKLDSIDFYSDAAMTKLVYQYQI